MGATDEADVERQKKGSVAEANQNINVRMAFIHVLGDMLQSLAVLLAAILIYVNVSTRI